MTSKSRNKRNRAIKLRYRRLARKRARRGKPPRPPDEKDPPISVDTPTSNAPTNPSNSPLVCNPSLVQPPPNITHSDIQLIAPHKKHKCRYVFNCRFKRLPRHKREIKMAHQLDLEEQIHTYRSLFPHGSSIHQSNQVAQPQPTSYPSIEQQQHPSEADNSLPCPSTPVDKSIDIIPTNSFQPISPPVHLQSTHRNQLNHQVFWLIGTYFRSIFTIFYRKRHLTVMWVVRCALAVFILTLVASMTQNQMWHNAESDTHNSTKFKLSKKDESVQHVTKEWLSTLNQKQHSF